MCRTLGTPHTTAQCRMSQDWGPWGTSHYQMDVPMLGTSRHPRLLHKSHRGMPQYWGQLLPSQLDVPALGTSRHPTLLQQPEVGCSDAGGGSWKHLSLPHNPKVGCPDSGDLVTPHAATATPKQAVPLLRGTWGHLKLLQQSQSKTSLHRKPHGTIPKQLPLSASPKSPPAPS